MANLAFGLFCLVGGFVGVGILIGWLAWGRKQESQHFNASRNHHAWLVQQSNREPLLSLLTDDQRQQIRDLYGPGTIESTVAEPVAAVSPASQEPATDPGQIPYLTDSPIAVERPDSPLMAPPETIRPPRPSRDPLDPAALLLYAGAFLIAAAGVVYSAYNWADLAAWQKLGMLALLTIAFGGLGWFLLGNQRLRQAGETFVAIAAMLIPANAIAAWTVSTQSDASTSLIILVGAAITALVHGIFSIRPGGTVYAHTAPLFGWLALGAIPAAVGLSWGWGGPLVILAVGLARSFEPQFLDMLRHLQRPIRQTGMIALVLAFLAASATSADGPTWLSMVTFASLTFTFGVFAAHSAASVWGTISTITGLLALFSLLGMLSDDREWIDRPWFASPFLVLVSIVLVSLGERGPEWLRRWGTRLTLQIEAVVMLVGAAGATGGERWLLVAVAAAATGVTGWIAWVRNDRWVLLLTGVSVVGGGLALAYAIGRPGDWSTAAILVLMSVLAIVVAATGWFLDRWSERTKRLAWGVPLWIVAGLTAIWANAVVLTADDLEPGQAIWAWLAGANLVFAALSLLAARSTAIPAIRIITGAWMVAVAVCVATWPDLLLADRLTVALLMLVVLIVMAAMVSRRMDKSSSAGAGYESLLPGLASLLVLVGMVLLSGAWLFDANTDVVGEAISARWTWVSYTLIFGLLGLATGWFSLRPRNVGTGASMMNGTDASRIATWISTGFLTLTTLLGTRMATDREAALVVSLVLVSWVLYSLAITLGSRLDVSTIAELWRFAALVVAGLAVLWSFGLPESGNDLSRRSWLTITLISFAGMLAAEGWLRRQQLVLTSASGVAMVALLVQIDARDPENILAYSLPLGIYLLALGAVNRRIRELRDVLLGAGSGVLLVPVLWLAQREGAIGYLTLAAGIALALFLGGIALRLRVPIAAGVLGLTAIVLRLLVDAVLALESWVALLVVGLVLLAAGTAALVWKDALRARLERIQRGWHEMG